MVIDAHSHLNFNAYRKDLDEVIKRTLDSGIWAINVGSKYETSRKAVEIAQKYEGMYAAIGLHPIYAAAEFQKVKTDPEEGSFLVKEEVFDEEKYRELLKYKKVVAIGEIGLDYYYKPKTTGKLNAFKEKQKQIFLVQLNFAQKNNLPVILHCRMAHNDLLKIIEYQNIKGVIHCFTGNWKEAQEYMKLGLYLGINGIIFKMNLDEVIKKTPLDRILVETDCPYLTPPQEGSKRNEPIFITHVIQKIAEIKGIDYKEVAGITASNAKKLFAI
jgi:TatD DNase family protein